MPFMTWELWLARDIVTDNPLPWQKSLDKLTPKRVAQAMRRFHKLKPARLGDLWCLTYTRFVPTGWL